MIYKENLFIQRDINGIINGNFYVDDISYNDVNIRSSNPGFIFSIVHMEENAIKVQYEYILKIKKPCVLNGNFIIITDREDIVIPYTFDFIDNSLINEINIENPNHEEFKSQTFASQFDDDSLEKFLWEVYSKDNVSDENINEFFIAIGKKTQNETLIDNTLTSIKSNQTKNKKDNIYFNIKKCLADYINLKISKDEFKDAIKDDLFKLNKLNDNSSWALTLEYVYAFLDDDYEKKDQLKELLNNIDISSPTQNAIIIFVDNYKKDATYLNDAISRIEIEAYRSNDSLCFWLLFKLKEKIITNSNELYLWLKKIVALGSKSPYIYGELLKYIYKFDTAILQFDTTEVTVLYWAYKHNLLSTQIIDYIIRNSIYISSYDKQILKILQDSYNNNESNELLSIICMLIIRGNKMDDDAFFWYLKGIEHDVKITSIYEYFLYSMPNNYYKKLPKKVYLYFKDNTMLSDKNRQQLYANIIKNKTELDDIYEYYRKAMNEYMLTNLRLRKINESLAILYKEFEMGIILDKELSHCLLNIYCAYKFSCENTDIVKLIIVQHKLSNPIEVILIDGVGHERIVDSNFYIIMVTKDGRKIYDANNSVKIHRLLDYTDDVNEAFKIGNLHIVSLINKEDKTYEELLVENKKKYLRSFYKKKIQSKLLWYSTINNNINFIINDLDINLVDNKESLIKQCIVEEMFDVALNYIYKFDINVSTDDKLRIFNGYINSYNSSNICLIYLGLNILDNNIINKDVLKFLYRQGILTLNELIDNYYIVKSFINNSSFLEKIGIRCCNLLLNNNKFEDEKFYSILWENKEILNTAQLLEILRRFSVIENIVENNKVFIAEKLNQLVESNIYLPWFMNFKHSGILPNFLNDKVVLVFNKSGYIKYNYVGERQMHEKKLNLVVDNMYVVAITMFYGEKINYILMDKDYRPYTDSIKFKNIILSKSNNYKDGIDLLNDIFYAKDNNLPTLNSLIWEYKKLKDFTMEVFKPKE